MDQDGVGVAGQASSLLRLSYMLLTTLLVTGVLILYRLFFGGKALYTEAQDGSGSRLADAVVPEPPAESTGQNVSGLRKRIQSSTVDGKDAATFPTTNTGPVSTSLSRSMLDFNPGNTSGNRQSPRISTQQITPSVHTPSSKGEGFSLSSSAATSELMKSTAKSAQIGSLRYNQVMPPEVHPLEGSDFGSQDELARSTGRYSEEQINSFRRKHIDETDGFNPSPDYHTPPISSWPEEMNETYSFKANYNGQLTVKVLSARNLQSKNFDTSNPFCEIRLDEQYVSTSVIHNTLEPEWNESYKFNINNGASCLALTISHDDPCSMSDNYMGSVRIPVSSLPFGEWKDTWASLGFGYGEIHLQLMFSPASQEKVGKDTFKLLKVLGRGTYGKVHLVSKDGEGTTYAMKSIRKEVLLTRHKVANILMEKHVLKTVKSPFLVGLKYSFQTESKLYLVLDYVGGGELFFHLKKRHHFQEHEVVFYIAEIVLGLETLHQLKIVYRDLKPENVMLDEEGHVRLTDFGLCKLLKDDLKTRTFCGTPEYLAPEVLLGEAYGFSFDWWCVGILAYEMLVGLPPFYHRNKNTMYNNILKAPLMLPGFLSQDASSFLQAILERNPDGRLGCGAGGVNELKSHPFFKSVNWTLARERKLIPPMKPDIEHVHDVSNFDPIVTKETPRDSFVDHHIGSSDQEMFAGFSYDQRTL